MAGDFTSTAYMFAAFLTLYGVMFLYIASKTADNSNDKQSVWHWRSVFFIFGFAYLALAHWTFLIGLGNTLYLTNLAPCQQLLSNSTDVNSTFTVYTFVDSCATREVPKANERLYVIFTYTIFLEAWMVFLGALGLVVRKVLRWS